MNSAINMIVEMLTKSINSKNDAKYPYFADKRYTPHPLDTNNFHKIHELTNNPTIAAVDGGNMEIISSPDFSLSLIRIAVSAYKNNKKINLPLDEIMTFLCLSTSSVNSDNCVIYTTNFFPLNPKHEKFSKKINPIVFDSFDQTISTAQKKASISMMGSIIRRFLEWVLLEQVCNVLEPEDILLKDGSLQTGITGESAYSNQLYAKALKKNIHLCGISKTTTLLTDTGTGLGDEITNLSKNLNIDKWIYNPVCNIEHSDHKAEMYFVKLNTNSNHAFRLELLKEQKQSANAVIGAIAKNAIDLSFPGYPYALIDVDRLARVRYNEIEHYRVLFMATAAKNPIGNKIINSVSSIDAHEILNRMIN